MGSRAAGWATAVAAVGPNAVRHSPIRVLFEASAFALLFALAPGVVAQRPAPPVAGEYDVKAAFLYNFAEFVIWPGEGEEVGGNLTLCVVGPDPFGPALERVLEGKAVRGRPIVMRRLGFVDEVGACDLVFVSESLARDPHELLAAARGRGILTIADSGDFARRGGAINLVDRGNRVAFEINPAAVKREGLQVSSKLLRLATLVGE